MDLASAPLLRLVSLAGQLTTQRWNRIMSRQHGLTASGANVLALLAWANAAGLSSTKTGRVTHTEMARHCGIRPATLTGIVDTLERAGYLRRERDGTDRRVVWLTLTDDGWRRARDIGCQMRDVFPSMPVMRDVAKAAIIREFLIDIISYPGDDDRVTEPAEGTR
jgi:DNA-binding MarR family transcriptional regulator